MFTVELYAGIRRAVMVDGLSRREAAKRFGVHRNTITKMLQYSAPPGYRRRERPASKKLGAYMAWIDAILEGDRSVHKKQRHTAQRIFERLRDERGFSGGYTIVREYVAQATLRAREMFVPLSHRPGHAQVDFGEADGYIAGKKVRFHYLCMDLPHSDGCFVKAYPAETAESFCDGHVAAFDFFGGVPQSILYDNTRLAVARIVKGGKRLRSQMFAELQSHYLFEDKFGRPGKGNDKGKVEGLVGFVRRNFMTPLPVADSFDALNARFLDACMKRRQGMSAETAALAFDPFYTTKPFGAGTGLGLSMVHGFARQSGGDVKIETQLGKGTAIKVYLPRYEGIADEPAADHAPAQTLRQSPGGETIVVVDDEPLVRMLITDALSDAGYLILEASEGHSALKLLQANPQAELLVTDVGLPGSMNGRQLADAARSVRPDLKVLFVTGYAGTAAA